MHVFADHTPEVVKQGQPTNGHGTAAAAAAQHEEHEHAKGVRGTGAGTNGKSLVHGCLGSCKRQLRAQPQTDLLVHVHGWPTGAPAPCCPVFRCKDPSKTVVVRVTDTCPCWYPANAASNKRW
jgi:hypothetical protein